MVGTFHNESDGYTYNCETLLGLWESRDEAETALLQRIETAQQNKIKRNEFENRYNDLRTKFFNDLTKLENTNHLPKKVLKKRNVVELEETLRKTFQDDIKKLDEEFQLPDNNHDPDISHYEIKELPIGEFLDVD